MNSIWDMKTKLSMEIQFSYEIGVFQKSLKHTFLETCVSKAYIFFLKLTVGWLLLFQHVYE